MYLRIICAVLPVKMGHVSFMYWALQYTCRPILELTGKEHLLNKLYVLYRCGNWGSVNRPWILHCLPPVHDVTWSRRHCLILSGAESECCKLVRPLRPSVNPGGTCSRLNWCAVSETCVSCQGCMVSCRDVDGVWIKPEVYLTGTASCFCLLCSVMGWR